MPTEPGSGPGPWPWARVSGFALAIALFAASAQAQAPSRLEVEEEITISGDVRSHYVMRFGRDAFEAMRRAFPSAVDIALAGLEADPESVVTETSGRYEPATSVADISLVQAGAAKNRGAGRWEYSLAMDESVAELADRSVSGDGREEWRFDIRGAVPGTGRVRLPPGAMNAAWDARRQAIAYTLPAPPASAAGRLDLTAIDVNPTLMATVYKVYADRTRARRQWTMKAVFRNGGAGPLLNLRVRFRVPGYSEWSSPDRFPELVPGETVVAAYYPQLDSSISRLTSPAHSNVEAEWTFTAPGGSDITEGESRPVRILGAGQVVLSRPALGAGGRSSRSTTVFDGAELLGAWLTPEDPVVREFGAWASRRAGGVLLRPGDDEAARRLLGNIYELWLDNDFVYINPSTFGQRQARAGAPVRSFDETQVQTVRLPRDVIKDRSGTCIETSLLFASMASAMGFATGIALVPGHAFPFVVTSSGKRWGVETSWIGGGDRPGSPARTFAAALEEGTAALRLLDEGRHPSGSGVTITMDGARSSGVFPPELPPLSAAPLREWGMRSGREGDYALLGSPVGSWAGVWKSADSETPVTLRVGPGLAASLQGRTSEGPMSCAAMTADPGMPGRFHLKCRFASRAPQSPPREISFEFEVGLKVLRATVRSGESPAGEMVLERSATESIQPSTNVKEN